MRAKGMTYDTGFIANGHTSRRDFDPEVVRRELKIIRDNLHCTAVQIVGGDADRLEFLLGDPETRGERLTDVIARLDSFLGKP